MCACETLLRNCEKEKAETELGVPELNVQHTHTHTHTQASNHRFRSVSFTGFCSESIESANASKQATRLTGRLPGDGDL